MNCEWILERIDPYLDDELSQEETLSFEHHTNTCPACAGELVLARGVLSELRELPTFECPSDVVEKAAVRAGVVGTRKAEERYVPTQRPADGWWNISNWFGGRLAGLTAMLVVIAAIGLFVLTGRSGIDEQYTEAEIEKARQEAMIAFAYVGKYTSRGATVFRDDVMIQRIIPTMRRAIAKSGNEVAQELFVPRFRLHEKNVTNDQLERFDK